MKYQVLWSEDSEVLSRDVTASLEDGWKCQGGVSMAVEQDVDEVGNSGEYNTVVKNTYWFAQAMVKP